LSSITRSDSIFIINLWKAGTITFGERRYTMKIIVLVVEDEFLLRADTVEFLEEAGFVVHQASNADEAIALLELHVEIQVVFTDIQMPGSMDGLKLAHYVRGRWPPIKLIVTSGLAKPLVEHMPIGTGFVGKPYQLMGVADSVRELIGAAAHR
jgi:two-component system, response regulator PdtaR